MSLKDTVLRWAQDHQLLVEQHPVDLDSADKLAKKYGSTGENMCQDFVLDETISKCANYPECKGLSLWTVKSKGKVVGLMLFSPHFSARSHYWGDQAFPGFHVQHRNFEKDEHQVSDLLVFCARGGPKGVGQLLVLLALALSGPKGLFVQVGLVMKSFQLTRDNMTPEERKLHRDAVGETYFVQRPYYSQAAFHIYGKLGFEHVHVHDDYNRPWTSLYFYRPNRPTRKELMDHLSHLDSKGKKSRKASRRMEQVQDHTFDLLDDILPEDPNLFGNMMHADQFASSSPHDNAQGGVGLLDFPQLNRGPSGNLLDMMDPFPGAGPNQVDTGSGNGLVLNSDVPLTDLQIPLSPGFLDDQFGFGGGLNDSFDFGQMGRTDSLDFGQFGRRGSLDLDNMPSFDFSIPTVPAPQESSSSIQGPTIVITPSKPAKKKPAKKRTKKVKTPPTCPECQKVFTRATNMRRHHKTHFETKKTFPCPHCKHKAHRSRDLQLHMDRKHSRIKPYKCDICKHTSGSLSDKYSHMEKKHKHSRRKRR
jgi:hypothetical protein